MSKTKRAKFFCEYCNTEVPQKAVFCTKCGHFFASVRCPECGHTGDQSVFSAGCPKCGYAFSYENSSTPIKYKNKKKLLKPYNKSISEDSLPCWIYLVTASIFTVLIAVFIIM